MREIEVSGVLDVPRAEVERKLSPESILEYVGTYTVESVDDSGEKTVVRGIGDEIELVAEFTEHEDGYAYVQRGDDGPFEEMRTRITVEGNGETRVSIRSEFTFGGWFSFLTDWLGTDVRREELERLLVNLAREVGPEDTDDR